MGVDWELLERVNNEGIRAQKAYRCPFVEALQAHRSGRASFNGELFVRTALDLLAQPWIDRNPGRRFSVYAEESYEKLDFVYGEFEAR